MRLVRSAAPLEAPDRAASEPPLPRWLPPLALLVYVAGVSLVLTVAGDTHNWDYVSYHDAAVRFLEGRPIHDPASDLTGGGQGIYLYPPAFAIAMVPFVLLPPQVEAWVWTLMVASAFVVGTLLLPVRRRVSWSLILIGGLSWPLLYSIKLGQVETLLFLAAAVGWRWMERPVVLGLSIAAGAVIKLQPVALLGWAIATRRWKAAAVGLLCLGVAFTATAILAPRGWPDFIATLQQVGTPVTRPHNYSPGAVLFQAGLTAQAAVVAQWVSVLAAGALTVWAWFRLPAVPSFLLTLLAVQIASPLLRDHYTLLLFLPAAWLLDRGRWWGALLPLAFLLPLAPFIPAQAYPMGFWIAMVLVAVEGRRAVASGSSVPTSPLPA